MISGKGITHSERTPKSINVPHKLFGIQCWIALPKSYEGMTPEFHNFSKKDIPSIITKSMMANIILGAAYGKTSPLKNVSNGFFAEIKIVNSSRESNFSPSRENKRSFFWRPIF